MSKKAEYSDETSSGPGGTKVSGMDERIRCPRENNTYTRSCPEQALTKEAVWARGYICRRGKNIAREIALHRRQLNKRYGSGDDMSERAGYGTRPRPDQALTKEAVWIWE